MICKIAYIFLFIICSNVSLLWGQTFVFRGTVLDEQTHKALDYATVQLFVDKQIVYGGITDANGHFELLHIHPGTYRVIVSYLGYDSTEKEVKVIGDISAIFYLKPSVMALNEVVVTASESKRATSASIVDRTAMKHLQPSSFSDLMELVPGGKSADPQMGQANLIRIRETGKTEDISSLGVGFYIDGISQNTDANLQYMPNSTSAVNATSTMSKGIDMRTISTDNIEKVEIIRGIPSVAYGNVANGAVIIQRISPSLSFRCLPVCRQHSGSVDPLYRISLIHCSRMRMSSRIVYNLPKNCCRYHSPIPKHPNRIRNPPSICIPSVPFLLRSLCGQISVAGRIHPGALPRPSRPFHAEWPADRSRRPLLFVRPACPFPPPVHPLQ